MSNYSEMDIRNIVTATVTQPVTQRKTAAQIRQELIEAERIEAKEATDIVLAKFKGLYEGQYFWFERKWRDAVYVGICMLDKFEISPDAVQGFSLKYTSTEIRMCHVTSTPSRWKYGECPLLLYGDDRYRSCKPYETPTEYVSKTRDATKAEFKMLINRLQQITTENLAIFSGQIVLPDLEPGERMITTGQL